MDEYVDELTTLGLSSYEARVYVALVENGVMTADDVATEADVPIGRIYDVLNSLADRSLVRADDGRPRTYAHVEPSMAIDRVLGRRRNELETKRGEYERTASSARRNLTALVEEVQTEQFATSAFHDVAARDLLVERFGSAAIEIRIYVDSIAFRSEICDAFVTQLEACLDDGIDVRLLATEFDPASPPFTRLLDSGVRIRRTETVPHQRFVVIDDREVCVEILDPVHADDLLAVVNFRDDGIAADLASSFDECWRRTGPGY